MRPEEKENQILEAKGLWKASSFIRKHIKQITKKREPIRIGCIKQAHKILFDTIGSKDSIGGQYRKTDTGTKLKNINGNTVLIAHWTQVPNRMAILDYELKNETKNLNFPKTPKELNRIINLATKCSHELALITAYENGNGRASILLIDAIMLRASLYQVQITNKSRYLRSLIQADKRNLKMLDEVIAEGLAITFYKVLKENKKI